MADNVPDDMVKAISRDRPLSISESITISSVQHVFYFTLESFLQVPHELSLLTSARRCLWIYRFEPIQPLVTHHLAYTFFDFWVQAWHAFQSRNKQGSSVIHESLASHHKSWTDISLLLLKIIKLRSPWSLSHACINSWANIPPVMTL